MAVGFDPYAMYGAPMYHAPASFNPHNEYEKLGEELADDPREDAALKALLTELLRVCDPAADQEEAYWRIRQAGMGHGARENLERLSLIVSKAAKEWNPVIPERVKVKLAEPEAAPEPAPKVKRKAAPKERTKANV